MALSLDKKVEMVRLSLEKRNVPNDIIMQVKLALDVSGSAKGLYQSGAMQELVDRFIPVAMRFDDNQSLESYAFSDSIQQMQDVKPEMFGRYVNDFFLDDIRSGVLWSGTKYSVALEGMMEDFISTRQETIELPASGFFGKLFGKTEKQSVTVLETPTPPVYIGFATDGETNNDESQTEAIIQRLTTLNTYIQFLGIGRENFRFLKRMADKYGHVGFATFPDLANTSDQAMYDALITDEVCEWIKSR